jgi:uncharacterized protein YwgA
MDRYQLAKLVQWAGETAGQLEGRKRMQKVVFLLQCAGCPFEAEYTLHHYGPYSSELAQLTDEMVQVGLLQENSATYSIGQQFTYQVNAPTVESLTRFEQTEPGKAAKSQLADYEQLAKEFLALDVYVLEYAATIAYFNSKGFDWDAAFQQTCSFKQLTPDSPNAKSALSLAHKVIPN